jgi:hypothetical protein
MAKAKSGGRQAQADAAAAAAPSGAAQASGNRPVAEFRLGRVRASVWKNTNSKQETWYSVVLTRGYKDAQAQWKNSHSLGLDDLLVAGEVLKQAALWIYAERQGDHAAKADKAPAAAPNGTQEGPSSDLCFAHSNVCRGGFAGRGISPAR